MSSIPSLTSATATSTDPSDPTAAATHQTTLGQDDFLKLLVAQMSAQDPLDPIKDTEFVAQLAQFSALQQSQAMATDMAGMRSDQQVLQANTLLGRTVTLNLDDGTQTTGVVGAVQLSAGTPYIIVNGQGYDLSQLAAITPTPATN
jgi:flagellar basal-body rod modification protein FlgD